MPNLPSQALRVLAVPAFKDNYLWLVHDGAHAAVVDPGDAAPVLQALAAHHLTLASILLTHHHADHTGGVPALLERFEVPVFGPRGDGIGAVTVPLSEGDMVDLPKLGLRLEVLDVPGHTRGHIAYVRQTPGAHWLFCGDTLFAGGCGRLFEGTPAQMAHSLEKLATLADDTEVFCAHEYTMSNLRFAQAAEPGNAAIIKRIATESAKRERGMPTIPSTIGIERQTNPFLRYREPGIAAALRDAGRLQPGADDLTTFASLREWKNTF
ncbi:MAG: hydroxyacylglutathione hydrolase [Bdellovibrionales bacterium]|nr:hydroxyacylglutathione hydrolase [Massilia sp.]